MPNALSSVSNLSHMVIHSLSHCNRIQNMATFMQTWIKLITQLRSLQRGKWPRTVNNYRASEYIAILLEIWQRLPDGLGGQPFLIFKIICLDTSTRGLLTICSKWLRSNKCTQLFCFKNWACQKWVRNNQWRSCLKWNVELVIVYFTWN